MKNMRFISNNTKLPMKLLFALSFFIAPLFSVIASGDNNGRMVRANFETELTDGFLVEESNILLEGWMADIDRWNFPGEEYQVMNDHGILESWMTSKDHWGVTFDDNQFVSDLNLEPWMLDPCHWNFISRNICDVKFNCSFSSEENLLQTWMKDPYFFQI